MSSSSPLVGVGLRWERSVPRQNADDVRLREIKALLVVQSAGPLRHERMKFLESGDKRKDRLALLVISHR